jgi:hypothetical protein
MFSNQSAGGIMSDINKSLIRVVTNEYNRRLSARFKDAVKTKTVGTFDASAAKQDTIDDVFGVVREIIENLYEVDSDTSNA